MSTFRRVISFALALVMAAGLLPVRISASEAEEPFAETVAETTVSETEPAAETEETTVPPEQTTSLTVPEETEAGEETVATAPAETAPIDVTEPSETVAEEETVPQETGPSDPAGQAASEMEDSGTCGEDLTWTLDDAGTLTISGTGPMTSNPWTTYGTAVKTAVIEDGVTSIVMEAFYGCYALSGVTIPETVTVIEGLAFFNCYDLQSVTIPEGVTEIGAYAFEWTGLTAVHIPSTVEQIGEGAFRSCRSLQAFTVAEENAVYCAQGGVLFAKDPMTLIQYPGGRGKAYTIPDGVTEIGDYAFYFSAYLSKVIIPDSVVTIGEGAFESCYQLAQVTLPESITDIGRWTFGNCSALSSVVIPAAVSSIGSYAFGYCEALERITFRGSAPSMDENAFCDVTAAAWYPDEDATWTEAVMQNYGGTLTWELHPCINGHTAEPTPAEEPNCTETGLTEGSHCSICGEILTAQEPVPVNGVHVFTGDHDTTCDLCGYVRQVDEPFPYTFYEWEVLRLTNAERVAEGLDPLTGFTALQTAGDIRADELLTLFSHTRPDGTSCTTVLAEVGLDFGYVGENIAYGYRTPAAVVDGWMNSSGHRANILGDFSHIAVGENSHHWVQMFTEGDGYTSVRLPGVDRLVLEPGTSLDELYLVAVLNSSTCGNCYLPVAESYCEGYDANTLGDQTVTLSVLGVSTTFVVHMHDWSGGNCTTPKICIDCGETEGEAPGHKYSSVVTAPTCTQDGYTTKTCTVCGEIVTEDPVPALGHTEAVDAAVPPTCSGSGLTEGTHCTVCGEILVPQSVVEPLGHAPVIDASRDPTCVRTGLTEGQHCDRCGEVLIAQENTPAIGHDFAEGYCRNCGGEDRADYTLFSEKNVTLSCCYPETGELLSTKQITWTMSEEYEPFAVLSKTGKLTAKKLYEKVRVEAVATITATGESLTYLVDIFPAVTQAELTWEGETVNGKTLLMGFAEEALILEANAYPSDTLAAVTWTISDGRKEQFAAYTIDGNRVTIANPTGKLGTVTIKAAVNAGVQKTATVKIQFGSFAQRVEIREPEKTTIRGGETLDLSAAITEPESVTKPGIVWTVSDKTAATISNGRLKAKNVAHPVTVTVTAASKDGQASDTVDIRILPKNEGTLVLMQDGRYVTNTTVSANAGDTYQLEACTILEGEPSAETVTWTSGNGKAAQVDETGRVTAIGKGTARITACASDGRKAVVTIKVSTLAKELELTTRNGKNLLVENGETLVLLPSGRGLDLAANVLPAGTAKAVTWEIVQGGHVAKIASSGKLTANKDLTAVTYVVVRATAKDGSGCMQEIRAKVVPAAQGVQIYEDGLRVRSNTTYISDLKTNPVIQLSAKVYPASAMQDVEMTSSNKKVAYFDAFGALICVGAGSTNITATALDGSKQKSTFKLTVVKRIEDISLKEGLALDAQEDLFVAGGKGLKLAAMLQIAPADATNRKLLWSVSPNAAGVQVNASGSLTTKKVTEPVTVTVTAAAQDGNGKSLCFAVTVYPATTKLSLQANGTDVTGKVLLLRKDEHLDLDALGLPGEAAGVYSWTSSNAAYVRVEENGTVTALQSGRTITITCKAEDGTGKKATVRIKVI